MNGHVCLVKSRWDRLDLQRSQLHHFVTRSFSIQTLSRTEEKRTAWAQDIQCHLHKKRKMQIESLCPWYLGLMNIIIGFARANLNDCYRVPMLQYSTWEVRTEHFLCRKENWVNVVSIYISIYQSVICRWCGQYPPIEYTPLDVVLILNLSWINPRD